MPGLGGWVLDYGVEGILFAGLLLSLWWGTERHKEARDNRTLFDTERDKHNTTALTAANQMYEQKILNQEAKSSLELWAFKYELMQRELEKCERSPPRSESTQ